MDRKELRVTNIRRVGSKRSPWKAEAWVNGIRVKSKSFSTKAEALDWKKRTEIEYSEMKNMKSIPRKFEELITRYTEQHLPTVRPDTANLYLADIEKKINPFFRFYNLDRISPSLIEDFRANLLKSSLSPKTINNSMQLLRSIFNKAVEWEWLEKSPYRLKNLKVDNYEYRWWNDKSHIRSFLKAIRGDRYEAAYRLGLEFGLRLGEVCGLSKADVCFDAKVLKVHRQWLGKQKRYGPPKHNKSRYLHFESNSDFCRSLRRSIDSSSHEEAIFLTKGGHRVLNRKLGGELFSHRIKLAGVPQIRFHDLRHTFASWYMIQNGDIWALMQILGHSNISTTMRYAHHSKRNQKAPGLIW